MSLKSLTDKAIQAALKQDWHQAIEINLEILDKDPFHIPTLNRLGRAYKETGQVQRAIQIYEQVIKSDRYNRIARSNLKKLCNGYAHNATNHNCHIDTNFIDEPGRTKTVPLTRLGNPDLIVSLQPGQGVRLVAKTHTICVVTENGDHVGALTDDMAYHLRNFLLAGNLYHTVIKSASIRSIYIFIRETSRAKKYLHTPTFATA